VRRNASALPGATNCRPAAHALSQHAPVALPLLFLPQGASRLTDFGTARDEAAHFEDNRQDAFVGTAGELIDCLSVTQ
jgi:hypothetical protein